MNIERSRDKQAYIHLSVTLSRTFPEYADALLCLLKRMHGQREPERLAVGYSETAVKMFALDNHRMVRSARSLADVGYRLVRQQHPFDIDGRVQAVMRRRGRTTVVRRDGAIEQSPSVDR